MDLAKKTNALVEKPDTKGPQNDEQLHAWILENVGLNVPRVCVCPDHNSPFEFLADLYFERVTTAIGIGNRGGSKTMTSAILHLLNSIYKPGCESAQVGAVEPQARRAYINLQQLLKTHGKVDHYSKHPMVQRTIERLTEFNNGSKLEILIGTPEGVNGPHPNKVAADEVELMDETAFQESRNMSQSKNGVMAQDWITSTRKGAHGPMQKLLDENLEAERAGADPPYAVYVWCVFESAENVPNCQIANPGLSIEEGCGCERVVKGSWDDGTPRRFTDICKGRLARSDGYLSKHDLWKTFRNTNQEVYEAQQLCEKPDQAGLVFPQFSRSRHGIKWYDPDPANGQIYMGADFGVRNPSAVNWYQVLNFDTPVYGYYQERNESPEQVLKAGTRVCFDEIYVTEIGDVELAAKVIERENLWRKKHPDFKVFRRFVDPQALGARRNWSSHKPPLYTAWYTTRDIKDQIRVCKELLRDNRIMIDVTRCEMFQEEAEFYHYPKKITGRLEDPEIPVDDFNHVMSNFRYTMMNLSVIDRKRSGKAGGHRLLPGVGTQAHKTATGAGASRYAPREEDLSSLHPFAGRKLE